MKKYFFRIVLLLTLALSNPSMTQWVQVNLDPPASIFSLYTTNNTIYAGGDSVLYFSIDGGKSWNRSSKVDNVEYGITAIRRWNDRILIGTAGRGVFSSSDNGLTWTELNNGLSGGGALEISSLEIRGDSLYAATIGEGIFVINLLNPNQWKTFRDGLPFGLSWNVHSLYNFKGSLFSGAGGNAKIYLNENSSATWFEKSFDLPAAEPNAMISISSIGDTLIGISYFGIYRSINNGDSWEYFNPGIGLINFGDITVVNDVVFTIISKLGRSYLLSSINSGGGWQFEFEFMDMGYSTAYFNGKLFTGRGSGLFYIPYNPSNLKPDLKLPDNFYLYQNYPNPFNPETMISWYMAGPGEVTLTIHDIPGNTVSVVLSEYRPAGMHSVRYNAGNLSSGVYFYKIQTGELVQTKKMLLLK